MQALIITCDCASSHAAQRALAEIGCESPADGALAPDAAIAFLAERGASIGLVLYLMGASRQQSLAEIERIRAVTRASLLVAGPADHPRLILDVIHAGANDYLDGRLDLAAQIRDYLSREKKSHASREGRVLAVVSASGGNGRTTVAVNLAAALARLHGQCALLDLDLMHADAALLLNLKPRHTIADLCQNLPRLDGEMLRQSITRHETGVHLLAAPLDYSSAGKVNVDAVSRILALSREQFADVVIDAPSSFDSPLFGLVTQVDCILLVTRLEFTVMRNAQRALSELRKAGVAPQKLKIVVNRIGQPNELPLSKARETLREEVVCELADDVAAVQDSSMAGDPVVCRHPQSRLSRGFHALARSLHPPAYQPPPAGKSLGWVKSLSSIARLKPFD